MSWSHPMRRAPPALDRAQLDQAAGVIKCLGHPLRLELLDAMEHGAATVSELQDRTGASQATVSQHLGVLRGHRVVQARREGSFVHYVITEPKVHRILDCIRGCGA
jgi:DNA-binding transcriptional ArsR family regulator